MTPNGRDEFESRVADAETHLSELTERLRAVERDRAALASAIARVRSIREDIGSDPSRGDRRMAFVDADPLRVRLGYPTGARIERIVALADARVAVDVRDPVPEVQRPDAREAERAAAWRELAAGARAVFVWGARGAGISLLLARMAREAQEHGLTDGAVFLRDVRGDVADVAARVAGEALGTARRFASFAELRRGCFGRRLLVVLDGPACSAADIDELCSLFPSFRFAAGVPVPPPRAAAVELGPLAPTLALTLIASGFGAPVPDEEERDAALRLCASLGMLPDGAMRLGRLAVERGKTFRSLAAEYGDDAALLTIAALGERTALDREVLAWLQAAGAAVPRAVLLGVLRTPATAAALDGLVDAGFLRDDCGSIALPADVARVLPPDPERAGRRQSLLEVLAKRSARADDIVDARTLAAAEALLADAFEAGWWEAVVRCGGPIADRCAEAAAFGAWGRVLNVTAAAAKRIGDDSAVARVYHDLAVRSMACGDLHDAAAYARAAVRERARIGDAAGERASREVLAAVTAAESVPGAERTAAADAVAASTPASREPLAVAVPTVRGDDGVQSGGDQPPRERSPEPTGARFAPAAGPRTVCIGTPPVTAPRPSAVRTATATGTAVAASVLAAVRAALSSVRTIAGPRIAAVVERVLAALRSATSRLGERARASRLAVGAARGAAAGADERAIDRPAAARPSASERGTAAHRPPVAATSMPSAGRTRSRRVVDAARVRLAEMPPAHRLGAAVALGGVIAIACAVAVIAAVTGTHAAPVSIAEASIDHPIIAAGSSARLCVRAEHAVYLAVIPDVGPIPAQGRQCVDLTPVRTTTYVVAAADDGGHTVRQTLTVAIRQPGSPLPRITSFTAPARVVAGSPVQLCYAVDRARLLRIVPSVGPLTRLRACRSVRLDDPHRYRYELVAIGDDGRSVSRSLRVTVVARATSAPAPAQTPRATAAAATHIAAAPHVRATPDDDRLARRAVYQFDVTPQVLARGQVASLCVGVGHWAQGHVSGIGPLTPGLTRCYRVSPVATTTYHLHVSLDRSVADEAVTVVVRGGGRAHEVARTSERTR